MRHVRIALQLILQNEDQHQPPDPLPIFDLAYADDMSMVTGDRDVAVTIIEVADPIFADNDLFLNPDKLEIDDIHSKAHIIDPQEPLFKGTRNFKLRNLGTYLPTYSSGQLLQENVQTIASEAPCHSSDKTQTIQRMHPPNTMLQCWPNTIPSRSPRCISSTSTSLASPTSNRHTPHDQRPILYYWISTNILYPSNPTQRSPRTHPTPRS